MENLRWILLLAGVIVILAVYLVSYYQGRRQQPARRRSSRTPPVINADGRDTGDMDYSSDMDEQLEQLGQIVAADAPAVEEVVIDLPAEKREPVTATATDRVFTLFVKAPRGVPFRGPILLGALADAKLEYGDMQIFHRIEMVNDQEKVLFSVANIREPGIFDLSAMENFTSEGVVLFMQVPGTVDAVRAFDAMVESARILAASLDTRVCDATQSPFTNQTISHMREEVIGCQLQQRVANAVS
ncbi:MAG: cell division protein ZipA [Gammaproteobacteria bacterium]|nr:cell division protein ZipA [Gammaproteobacteria bacterium]